MLETLRAALESPAVARVTLFCSPAASREFDLPADRRLDVRERSFADRSPLGRYLWHSSGVGRAVSRAGCSALLCLSNGGVARAGVPCATLIQQSLPFSMESLQRASLRQRMRFAAVRSGMRRSCRASRAVVVQTTWMRDAVATAFSVSPAKVVVCRPKPPRLASTGTASARLAPMRRVHPERRLLYVGNWSFYKNVETIALGMAAVQERAPGSVLFLSWPEVLQPRVPAHVVCLGRLSRAEVAEAFELSTVVAMPSLTETIALPLLEALSIGRPIVAADRPYAREVCGPRGALYFDPLDSDSFAAVASRLLQDRDLRSTIADDGRAWAAQAGSDDAYRWMVEAALWGPGCGADQAHA